MRGSLGHAHLLFIWENRVPRGTVIPNLYTSCIKTLVAETGGDKLGTWLEQSRNVYDDFTRASGEAPGRITAIGIMAHTDNTGDNAHAYYGVSVFKRVAPPRIVYSSD
jgi:hypothetical protein